MTALQWVGAIALASLAYWMIVAVIRSFESDDRFDYWDR